MNASFDTLAFAKRLETAGIKREFAEAVASAMQEVAMRDVATKADLEALKHDLTVRGLAGLVAAVGFLSALIALF